MITLTIYGEPIAKGRPRFTMRGRYPIAYTPKKTRVAEQEIIKQILPHKPKELLTTPIDITIKFYLSIPKCKSKKFIEDALLGKIRPDKKPDIDNLIKTILDALNTIFFEDDKQIVSLSAEKWYSDNPRTEITIRELV